MPKDKENNMLWKISGGLMIATPHGHWLWFCLFHWSGFHSQETNKHSKWEQLEMISKSGHPDMLQMNSNWQCNLALPKQRKETKYDLKNNSWQFRWAKSANNNCFTKWKQKQFQLGRIVDTYHQHKTSKAVIGANTKIAISIIFLTYLKSCLLAQSRGKN